MNKKNNKGFTLIELLVAVALMLSILGIAIVNFVNISDRKKEESWESVKSEIEIAAEQYFKANEYLFEGIDTTGIIEGSVGKISVGTLVNSDYLNVVTDPRSGQRVSYCMLVEVKKQNGVFTTTINNDNDNVYSNSTSGCDVYMEVETKVKDAPNVKVTYTGTQKNEGSGWYTGDVTVKIKITDDKGQIAYSGKCGTSSDKCNPSTTGKLTLTNDEHTFKHTDDTNGYNYCAWAKSTAGGETTNCGGIFKKDTEAPTFTVDMRKKKSTENVSSRSGLETYTNNTWFNIAVLTKVDRNAIKDNFTTANDFNISYTTTGATTNVTDYVGGYRNINGEGISTINYKVCDLAGNCATSGNKTIKLDRTPPTTTVNVNSTLSAYHSNVVNVDLSVNDDSSGITNVVYKDRKVNSSNASDYTWNLSSAKNWTKTLSNRTLFSTLSSTEVRTDTISLVATDAAGNSSKGETQYSGYQLCSKKNEKTSYGEWSSCSASCGGGTQTRSITKVYTDSNTGASCGSSTGDSEKQSCNTQACTKSCPTVTVNGASGSNTVSGVTWYRGDSIRFNHDGESGYWTWYRGTTNLGSTSKLLSKSEGILEGSYNYSLRGQNGEVCNSITVNYDNTPPTCSITCSGEKKGENGWMTGSYYSCTHTITDSGSGRDASSDKSGTWTENYNDTWTVTSKDLAGNTKSCSVNIKYENPSTVKLGIYRDMSEWNECKFESPSKITNYSGSVSFNNKSFYTAAVATACSNRPGGVSMPLNYSIFSGPTTELIDGVNYVKSYQRGFSSKYSSCCTGTYNSSTKDFDYACNGGCSSSNYMFSSTFDTVNLAKSGWAYEDRVIKFKSKAGNYTNQVRLKISFTETCDPSKDC